MNKIIDWLFLMFWIITTIVIALSKESFELFEWITLILISTIGLMLANYIFDNRRNND